MKSRILELIRRKGVRELLRENYLLFPLLVLFVVSSFGVYTRPVEFGPSRTLGVMAIAAYFVLAFCRYALRRGGDFQYVEVIGAIVLAINFLVQLTGGLQSIWFGLYMLLMVAVGINYSLRISLLTVARVALLEGFNALATALRTDQHFETERYLLWLLLLVVTAIVGEMSMVVLKRRLSTAERDLENAALRAEEEARERKKFLPLFAQSFAPGGVEIQNISPGEEPGADQESHKDVPDFETAFLGYLRVALAASHVCFFVRDKEEAFRLGWYSSEDEAIDPEGKFVEGQGLLGYCARNKTPLVGKRMSGASARSWRFDFVYLKSGGEDLRAYLVEPVIQPDGVVGVLVADRLASGSQTDFGDEFSAEERQMMQSAVAILELGWQRSQVAQREHQTNEILTTFLRIIAKMSATLKVDEVAALLVHESKNLLNYETAAVALLSEDAASYTLVSPVGLEVDPNAAVSCQEKTWVRWSVRSAEDALLFTDFHRRQGQMPIYTPTETPIPVGSFLAVPLGPVSHRRGALILTHSRTGQFSTETQQLLRLLCQHASVIVENAMTHRLVESLAVTDELTQLPNYRCFQDRVEEEISRARRNKKPLSLLMVDIDFFKKLNDSYGHPFGDAVLRQVGGIIERCLRREDFAARYGGEEFALLLPDTNRDGARQSAERLRAEIGRTVFTHEGNSAHVSISGGMATYPRDAETKEHLIENADRALYYAKRSGRNRIAQFHVVDTMQLPMEFKN